MENRSADRGVDVLKIIFLICSVCDIFSMDHLGEVGLVRAGRQNRGKVNSRRDTPVLKSPPNTDCGQPARLVSPSM